MGSKKYFMKIAMLQFIILYSKCVFPLVSVIAIPQEPLDLALDYYLHKNVPYLCYLSCDNLYGNTIVHNKFTKHNMRLSVKKIDKYENIALETFLNQRNVNIGVLLDGTCRNTQVILDNASQSTLFDGAHVWLVWTNIDDFDQYEYINQKFQHLNLSIDADISVVFKNDKKYIFTDIFNFGKIQGNNLEKMALGEWSPGYGLNVWLNGFKYYNRWNFHNLTLRAISVILERPKMFRPEMLSEDGFTAGVSAMTKVSSRLLNILKLEHNFRFNYTIAGRWIGSPKRNSTLAVTNALYWKEQDISSTCARLFPEWLEWVDPFFPPSTNIETKFYYLIPVKGVGDYENRFLMPLSQAVWWCACVAGVACALVLAVAAVFERRPQPGLYAFFSVFAAACQQAYEDGVQVLEDAIPSQGRRLTLLVVGTTSMLLYNYYTSSVVSWLLSAASPTVANLDGLINSELELIFEDIGYTRGWLDNPGFFYYSGFKNLKEDELREKKVTNAKRTVPLLQPPEVGTELIRSGRYAYHTEPYTASQQISRTFDERELCELGALQMMQPAPVYIMGQKRSPYKEFFVWSMMRLLERGFVKEARARVGGQVPPCSGRTPRALALGQAAPAFILLLLATTAALCILAVEIFWRSIQIKYGRRVFNRAAQHELNSKR